MTGLSANPSLAGQSVAFAAQIDGQFGGTPTGTVTFNDNGNFLGTATLNPNDAGSVAVLRPVILSTGPHTITTVYDGDATFAGSTASLTQTVTNPPPIVENPGGQSNVVGDNVFLPLEATVSDGDALTYGAAGLPAGLSIDPASGFITGTDAGLERLKGFKKLRILDLSHTKVTKAGIADFQKTRPNVEIYD